jgi:alpha/beta superfamily hydrolase
MAYNIIINGYKLGNDGAWIDDNIANVTTGAAVNIIIVPQVNTTTSPSVTLPINNNEDNNNDDNNYLDRFNKEQKKVEKFIDKTKKKLDKQTQKIEEKANKIWQYYHR